MVDLQTIGILVAAMSVVVGVAYNMYSLHLQTKNRQAQIYMNIWQKMNSKEWNDAVNLWPLSREIRDYKQWFELYKSSKEMENSLDMIMEVFEGVGVFVHDGLMDVGLVARHMGGWMPMMWSKYGPFMLHRREELHFPRYAIETEYLYNRLVEYGRRHPELQMPLV